MLASSDNLQIARRDDVRTLRTADAVMEAEGPLFRSAFAGAKVWILDPDRGFCEFFAGQFREIGWSPLIISRAKEFQRLLSDLNPDVLLLERFLPDIDGMDLLARVRAAGHLFPVLVHSDQATGDDRVRGLELGADEYLSKPLMAKELFLRIEKLLGWPDRISPRAAASLDCFEISGFLFDPSERSLSLGEQVLRLGRGDIAILLRFCLSPGVTLSRDELARSSGSLVDVSNSRSLDMRISNLRRQLSFLSADLAEMLETVRGRGYRLSADIRRVELAA